MTQQSLANFQTIKGHFEKQNGIFRRFETLDDAVFTLDTEDFNWEGMSVSSQESNVSKSSRHSMRSNKGHHSGFSDYETKTRSNKVRSNKVPVQSDPVPSTSANASLVRTSQDDTLEAILKLLTDNSLENVTNGTLASVVLHMSSQFQHVRNEMVRSFLHKFNFLF